MKADWKEHLERWRQAGLVDAALAERIHEYERAQEPQQSTRLSVILAVTLGITLSTLGIFLFIAAHWDQMSPLARLALVLSTVFALHAGGALMAGAYPMVSQALHTGGTLSLGGAIYLVGQTFNLEQHWPNGLLLWTIGALAGFALLRNWSQLFLAAVLGPWWLCAEFSVRYHRNDVGWVMVGILLSGLAVAYISIPPAPVEGEPDRRYRVRSLRTLGMVALIPAWTMFFLVVNESWRDRQSVYTLSTFIKFAVAALIPVALIAIRRGKDILWQLGYSVFLVASAYALTYTRGEFSDMEVSALAAVASLAFAAWGMREKDVSRLNLGVLGVAISALVFYFTHYFDRMERSFGLLLLGAIFLGGGWLLERGRKKMIARMQAPEASA